MRGLQREKPRLVDHHPAFGDALQPDALIGDAPAERDAAVEAAAHLFECALGPADGAHAVMNAARPEAALRDFEAAPFAEDDAIERHPHIRETDLAMPMRRIEIAEYRQHALLFDSGCVHGPKQHGLLLVPIGIFRVRLPHQDQDLCNACRPRPTSTTYAR